MLTRRGAMHAHACVGMAPGTSSVNLSLRNRLATGAGLRAWRRQQFVVDVLTVAAVAYHEHPEHGKKCRQTQAAKSRPQGGHR